MANTPPMQSPAIVQKVYKLIDEDVDLIDLYVFSNSDGTFFRKGAKAGPGPSTWEWPPQD